MTLADLDHGLELIEAIDALTDSLITNDMLTGARGLHHPDHANLIDSIKRRVKQIMARYFRRQKEAILEDVRLRFHVGKEYRESSGTDGAKRAEELLPESLSPLNFAATPKEETDYNGAIALAIKRAEKKLVEDLETTGTIGPNRVTQYLEEHGLAKLTGDIADTTKDRLRQAIAGAVDGGGTADDIIAAIKSEMSDFSNQRAEMIAQTEVNTAYNFGRHEIADAVGMTQKRWVTESGDPCEDCLDNEGADWIGITEAFPGGVLFPVQHPMCYCSADYRLVTAGEGL